MHVNVLLVTGSIPRQPNTVLIAAKVREVIVEKFHGQEQAKHDQQFEAQPINAGVSTTRDIKQWTREQNHGKGNVFVDCALIEPLHHPIA